MVVSMKKEFYLDNEESILLHSPFFPEKIRENDPIKAFLLIDNNWKEYRVWAYSPFGLEIIDNNIKENIFKINECFDLKINFNKVEYLAEGIAVSIRYKIKDFTVVGFRLFAKNSSVNVRENRGTMRFTCPEPFLPTGIAANPSKYNDFILFKVFDISFNGLKFFTSLRNKLLIKGLRLNATISFPYTGNNGVQLEIVYIETVMLDGNEVISVGTKFINPNKNFLTTISEYLLNFGEKITVDLLSKNGFSIKKTFKWMDFSYVKDKEDYAKVLYLRYECFGGGAEGNLSPFDMEDVYDTKARILTVKHKDKLVGTTRILFTDRYEDNENYNYVTYPIGLMPDPKEVVEVSRLCVDITYRKADIAYELINHLLLLTIKAGRRYMLAAAKDEEIRFYKKIGFKKLNSHFNHPLTNYKHDLIILDIFEVITKLNISYNIWNKVYKNLMVYLLDEELIDIKEFNKIKFNIFQVISHIFE